jgi:ABC-type glycerol-3-phosphate transport system permease component
MTSRWARISGRVRADPAIAITYVLLAVTAVVALLPIFWMLSTSLKTARDVFDLPIEWIPGDPVWENYPEAYNRNDFTRYFINSLIVAIGVTALHVVLASMAGYGLAKYRFGGRQLVLLAIIVTLVLPLEVIMIPLFLTVQDFGWLNTYQGLIVPVLADAFGVFLMRQYFLALPNALVEAARIDGAGHLRTFFTIGIPLAWPAIATLSIFIFRETWDDFLWPLLIVTESEMRTVPLGVRSFESAELSNFPQIMAISTIATIPLVILFFVFQRQFVRGIAMTGLRE